MYSPSAEVVDQSTSGPRPDIHAFYSHGGEVRSLYIYCQNFSEYTPQRAISTSDQLTLAKESYPSGELIVAFPGLMDDATLQSFQQDGYTVWDARHLLGIFEHEIKSTPHETYQQRLMDLPERLPQEEFLSLRLRNCPPGASHWMDYQKLVGEILTHLFCGPLLLPQVEHSDATKKNRRDFIFPNYAEGGFWRYLRDRYEADYIVVDAKNSAEEVGKDSVNQITNYLKGPGTGLFGIIVCRTGPSSGASTTVYEKWLFDRKLIVFVTDEDIVRMLLAKAAQGDPTRILTDIIQRFRLSI